MKKILIIICAIFLIILICIGLTITKKPKTQAPQPTLSPTVTSIPSMAPSSVESWSGTWKNSLGESGNETLEITNGSKNSFTGVWSGNINITGQWLDSTNIKFSGQTPTRAYQATGKLQGETLTIEYTATRLNTSGTYTGDEKLTRSQ